MVEIAKGQHIEPLTRMYEALHDSGGASTGAGGKVGIIVVYFKLDTRFALVRGARVPKKTAAVPTSMPPFSFERLKLSRHSAGSQTAGQQCRC